MLLGCQWNVISLYNFFLQKKKWVSNKRKFRTYWMCGWESLGGNLYFWIKFWNYIKYPSTIYFCLITYLRAKTLTICQFSAIEWSFLSRLEHLAVKCQLIVQSLLFIVLIEGPWKLFWTGNFSNINRVSLNKIGPG